MEAHVQHLIEEIKRCLTDDLLSRQYKKLKRESDHRTFGHCYVASEALYYLLGPESGWKPQVIRIDGGTHWYLKHKVTGEVLDVTAEQFSFPVLYEQGKGCGFLTKEPSKRCIKLLRLIRGEE